MILSVCVITGVSLRPKELLPILPVLLFVFILNCFRGGGEVILRYGPILFLKQGMLRGFFYSAVIIELFYMSRLLTKVFSPEVLLGTLSSLDTFVSRIFKPRNKSFFVIIYHVLGIFSLIYTELKIFFRGKKMGIKQKTVYFFQSVFEKSVNAFEVRNRPRINPIRPQKADYVLISAQLVSFTLIFALRGF